MTRPSATQGDVRKSDDTAKCVQQTLDKFQRLDILVNCAAGNFLVSASLSRTARLQLWGACPS